MRARRVLILAGMIAALAATSVAAQGRGNAFGRSRARPSSPTSSGSGSSSSGSTSRSSSSPSLSGDSLAVRQFGAWLDDASLLEPDHGWAALSFGYSRALGARQSDFPIVEAGVGLSRRAQFGATLPYYRLHFPDGTGAGGFGDAYLNVKYLLVDPVRSRSKVGVAVSPLVEVLNVPDPTTGSRLSWAVPISVEVRRSDYRVYGSAGYFARGAIFSSGALEVPVTNRLIVTGALIQMRSLNDSSAADTLGLSKNRMDLAGASAYFVMPSVAAFGSVGRTISQAGPLGASLMLNGGVSISFAGVSH